MPRNGSGTYTRPQSDYIPGTTILATSVNSDLNDMAQALTASIARDGQTIPTANMPMGNFRHTGVADGTARTDYAALGQTQNGAFLWGGTAGGTANAATISLNPPLAAYAAGQEFRFISGAAANTGAVTLNINSLGAVAVNKGDGTVALAAGDLPASVIVTVGHDGTRFRLVDPAIPPVPVPVPSITSATPVTASGSNVDFTAIPAGVKRVTLSWFGLSTNGILNPVIRLGTSGGIVATGYLGTQTVLLAATLGSGNLNVLNGLPLGSESAANILHGSATFELVGSNTWVGRLTNGFSNAAALTVAGCSVALGGVLDRVRLTTGGADTFDAGTVVASWET